MRTIIIPSMLSSLTPHVHHHQHQLMATIEGGMGDTYNGIVTGIIAKRKLLLPHCRKIAWAEFTFFKHFLKLFDIRLYSFIHISVLRKVLSANRNQTNVNADHPTYPTIVSYSFITHGNNLDLLDIEKNLLDTKVGQRMKYGGSRWSGAVRARKTIDDC
jgi:hypothetical protein